MNQEYRGRVKRHLEAGGDPKYVNVKKKAQARHQALTNSEKVSKKNGVSLGEIYKRRGE